jgi:DNA-binding MarR family transcriptional regulator
MSAFAAFHRTTKSTASQTLAALARKKLIRKLRDGRDGRVFRICVTAKGQHLLRHDPVNVLVEALSELSARERRGIAAAIGRMAQIFATRARRTR